MGKKDLIERLARAEDGRTTRRVEPGVQRTRTEAVRTRVSGKVVRRRRRGAKKDEAEAPPAVAAEESSSPPAEAPPAEPVEARPVTEEVPREPTAEVPREPTAEVPAPEPTPEPNVPEPVAAAAEPAAAQTPETLPKGTRPDKPMHPGLGKAVVMPPPGYDPANPTAYRRQVAETTPPKKNAFGRRRVEAGGRADVRGPRGPARPGGRGRRNQRMERGRMRPKSRRKSSGPKKASPAPKAQKRKVRVDNVISVKELAAQLGVKASIVIKQLMGMGMMTTVNEMLDMETAELVATEFDYEVENVGFQEDKLLDITAAPTEDDEDLESRPPVVTVMGHVDHGKTTLLDAIRSARVAQGEAGGITQHIGAYQVETEDSGLITFLDTPGHAAFSSMRARGAQVTDLVVLVVAADDGVQPQTEEAINHSKAAEVPIVVAVNKMDKPGVNADSIKQRLSDFGLVPEDWGGDTAFVPVSALRGDGIDELLETINLQAEILELQANPDRRAEGVVIEAKMERGRGAVASVLVQQGTLKKGDYVVLGAAHGKVRAILDHRGKRIKTAGPSTPVELFGLSDLPEVGDSVIVVPNEKNARKVADHRAMQKREAELANTRRRTADDIFKMGERANIETLNLVLKADVGGTLQAIIGALDSLDVDGTEIRVLHSAVGNISESDVNIVAADDAELIGFNVKVDNKAASVASELGVEPRIYSVIYDVLDDIEARLKGMLAPTYEEVHQGSVEVRALFKISKLGTIAGCYVQDGKVGRNNRVRVHRKGKQIWEGPIATLKRFKDDVKEVTSGYECGISLDGFNDLEEGDTFEVYAMEQVEVQ